MKSKSKAKHGGSGKLSMPVGGNLIGQGFPMQGTVQPNHMGSQSMSPDKEQQEYNMAMDTNMNSPSIDRGAYGPGY